jgi:hypothetical protein
VRTAHVRKVDDGVQVEVYSGALGLCDKRLFAHEEEACSFLAHSGWVFVVDGNSWHEPSEIVAAWTALPRPRLFEEKHPRVWHELELFHLIYRFETWGVPTWAFCYGLKGLEESDPVLGVLSVPPLRIEGIGGWASSRDALDMSETFLTKMEAVHGLELFVAAVHCYLRTRIWIPS